MKSRVIRALEVAVVTLAFAEPSTAQNSSAATSSRGRPELHAFRVARPPLIDGALDDEAWTHPPMETSEWLSYNPLNGDRIPQQTHVWVAYDDNYFYFAFKCDDPELRPGTVFYAGYGSLIEQRDFRNDAWIAGAGRYQTTRRGLFLKGSYLYRF